MQRIRQFLYWGMYRGYPDKASQKKVLSGGYIYAFALFLLFTALLWMSAESTIHTGKESPFAACCPVDSGVENSEGHSTQMGVVEKGTSDADCPSCHVCMCHVAPCTDSSAQHAAYLQKTPVWPVQVSTISERSLTLLRNHEPARIVSQRAGVSFPLYLFHQVFLN